MGKCIAIILVLNLSLGLLPAVNDNSDSDMYWRIRQEATENSQVMRLVHQLTDVYGPRLTGSPTFRAACEWALDQLRLWGLQNAHIEPWDFGHFGWTNDSYSVRVVSPYKELLDARVIAWTPSTKGLSKAEVVQIIPPERPTAERLEAYLNSVKDKVAGKIVLAGAHQELPVAFNPPTKRRDDSELRAQYDPENPLPPRQPERKAQANAPDKPLDPREVIEKVDAFLVANKALAKVSDSGREHGQIAVFANRTYNTARAVPGIVIRNEDYGRMCRLLADGSRIEMEIEILNTVHEDKSSLNVIAEIPGTDKKTEVVMLGAHIDSWHAGAGATDNATGVAVMMEATRMLRKLGIEPRRTIRIALWGGEEQGLLGSKAYVRKHFGTFEEQMREYGSLTAYLNLDSGTGRIRGASVFGPPESAAVLRKILHAFADLGVVGVDSTQSRSHSGTDSTCFSWAGLPAVNLSQDPIEYQTHTWHTNLDTYERVLEGDLKQCEAVVAALVYHLAVSEEGLPRFTASSMPPPEK